MDQCRLNLGKILFLPGSDWLLHVILQASPHRTLWIGQTIIPKWIIGERPGVVVCTRGSHSYLIVSSCEPRTIAGYGSSRPNLIDCTRNWQGRWATVARARRPRGGRIWDISMNLTSVGACPGSQPHSSKSCTCEQDASMRRVCTTEPQVLGSFTLPVAS